MDQLKAFLKQLNEHRFWVLTLIVVVTAATTWYLSTGSLQAAFRTDKQKIEASFNAVRSTASSELRNQSMIDKLHQEQSAIHSQSLEAWKVSYDRQAEVLKWPQEMALEAEQLDRFTQGKRVEYQVEVIPREWDRIFAKVRPIAKQQPGAPNPNAPMPTPMPMPAGSDPSTIGIVNWPEERRAALKGRYIRSTEPSELRVRITQEDLWVFESLVDIVAKMNEGATDPLEATIKHIDTIEIAQFAIREAQERPGADIPQAVVKQTGIAAFGGDGGLVKIPRDLDPSLLDGRYLDAANVAVPHDAPPPFSEFRQMFVVMRFIMDQRKIPDLVALCANAPLPVMTRQVVMHFNDIDTEASARQQGQGAGGVNLSAFGATERGPFDALVEIRGLVFLYSSVDESRLGQGSAPNPARRSWSVPRRMPVQQ